MLHDERSQSMMALLLWTLSGVGLGVYAAFGFGRFWLPAGVPHPALALGTWLAWALGGVLVAWALGEGTARLGVRVLGLPLTQARMQSAWIWAPLYLLIVGPVFAPIFLRVGGQLSLDVLGKIQWPGHSGFVEFTPAQYLYLLWAGPWLVLPWFSLLGLSVWQWWRKLAEQPAPAFVSRPMLLLVAFVFYLGLGLWTTTVYPPTGDEPHYLLMTHSLVQDHDLDLANNMARQDFRAFYPSATLDFHGVPAADGRLFSKHFPTLSFLVEPGYAALGRFGAVLIILLSAAAMAAVVHEIIRALGYSAPEAFLAWGVMLVSAPLGTYFDLIYTELPACLILGLGVLAWLRGGTRGMLGVGVAALLLPWMYSKYLPLAACLGLSLVWIPRRNTRVLMGVAAAALLTGGVYLWFFKTWYQAQLTSGHYGEFNSLFSLTTLNHALGLLLDRDYGLVATVPVLLLAVAGLLFGRVEHRPVRIFLGALWVVQYAFMSLFVDFTGSSSMLSRNAFPGIVLVFALVPEGVRALAPLGRGRSVLVGLLTLGSVGVTFLCTAWPMLRYLAPKQQLWARLPLVPTLFPSFTGAVGTGTYLWGAAWLVVLGMGLYGVKRLREVQVTTR